MAAVVLLSSCVSCLSLALLPPPRASQKPAAGGFSFGAASTPAFGAAPSPGFGASSASLFGAASTPAFGGGSLFGASQTAPTFSFAPAGQAAAAPAAGALVPAQPVQAPGVATSPYGVLPEPPKVCMGVACVSPVCSTEGCVCC